MLTAVRKLCGQRATGPSEVFDQSIDWIKSPISPPPARNARGLGSLGLSPGFMDALEVRGWRDSNAAVRLRRVLRVQCKCGFPLARLLRRMSPPMATSGSSK